MIECQGHRTWLASVLAVGLLVAVSAAMLDRVAASVPAGDTDAPWAIAYDMHDYDVAFAVRPAPDGGYVVLGHTVPVMDDIVYWLLKVDADGTVAWRKVLDGFVSAYRPTALEVTDDGGYVIVGKAWPSPGAGGADVCLIKLDADGRITWQKTYGGTGVDEGRSIHQTDDGGYVVTADTTSFGADWGDVWVLRLNAAGSVLWQKTYGGEFGDWAVNALPAADGGYVVAGYTAPGANEPERAWVFELDAVGSIVWQKTYGGPLGYGLTGFAATADGGYVLVGPTNIRFGEPWIARLDAAGDIVWQKRYREEEAYHRPHAVYPLVDGGYVVAGWTVPTAPGSADLWVVKLDSGGGIAWQRAFGGEDWEYAYAVLEAADGGLVVAGGGESFVAHVSDAWLLKLDPDGNLCLGCDMQGLPAAEAVDGQAEVGDGYAVVGGSKALLFPGPVQAYDADVAPQLLCACSLSIEKHAEPATRVAYHGAITYRVVLANHTGSDASGAVLTDTLPAEVDFARWLEQPARADLVDDRLTWSGTVTSGAAITFTFVVSHVGDYQDVVVNTANYRHATGAGNERVAVTVMSRYNLYLPLVWKSLVVAPPVTPRPTVMPKPTATPKPTAPLG